VNVNLISQIQFDVQGLVCRKRSHDLYRISPKAVSYVEEENNYIVRYCEAKFSLYSHLLANIVSTLKYLDEASEC